MSVQQRTLDEDGARAHIPTEIARRKWRGIQKVKGGWKASQNLEEVQRRRAGRGFFSGERARKRGEEKENGQTFLTSLSPGFARVIPPPKQSLLAQPCRRPKGVNH